MSENVKNQETLDSLEIGQDVANDDKLRASPTPPIAEKEPPGKIKALAARLLFVFILSGMIGYTYVLIEVLANLGDNPRVVIENSFSVRGGTNALIVGESLLTPNQRIENLGTIRQRSVGQNHKNVLDFLAAIAQDSPPDIYQSLIIPTIDNDLVEATSVGNLPKISNDGRTSLITYARPFNDRSEMNQVSIVIEGLGISQTLAEAAINLRPEVSLAFSPYTERLQDITLAARRAGHEVFLELPMEPWDYPVRDPGPYALRKGFTLAENISQLEWILSRTEGYVGLMNFQGDSLLQDPIFVSTVMPIILRRGIMFLEKTPDAASLAASENEAITREGTSNPTTKRVIENQQRFYSHIDISIGINDDEFSLEQKLEHALAISRARGRVTVSVSPFPLLLMKVALWITELPQDEFLLTPVSAAAQIHEAKRLGLIN